MSGDELTEVEQPFLDPPTVLFPRPPTVISP